MTALNLDSLLQDLRFAVRSFVNAPRFTVPALLALSLGIGATSAIFSVIRSVMLEPLPYFEPGRIVGVWETNRGGGRNVIAPANFVAWRERTQSLEHLGMVGRASLAMMIGAQPDRGAGLAASSGLVSATG